MTQSSGSSGSSDQSTGSSDRPATPRRGATPAVFGDGSTKEQQEQLLREKKETDKLVKDAADAERKARSGD